MHLIDEDGRIDSLDLSIDLTARMLHTKCEGTGNRLQEFVEVEFLLLEGGLLAVEHRHLEHFLHKEAQALRLVVDDTTQML